MNVQNAKSLEIEEGDVKTIHDKDGQLIWGAVGYDTKYAGDTFQQTYSGKNQLSYTLASLQSINTNGTWTNNVYVYNGITYTVNDDLSINVNGSTQVNAPSYLVINNSLSLVSSTSYILNGCPTDGGVQSYSIRLYDSGTYTSDVGSGVTFTYGTQNIVRINIFGGITVTNKLFKPMIRLATVTDDTYEPYCGGTASPNPDYPQDIDVVTGEQTVTISDGTNSEDFTIDLGSTELAKIGTYKDKIFQNVPESDLYNPILDEGDWYVHKAVGKVVLDGTQSIPLYNWRASDTSVGWIYAYNVTNNVPVASSGTIGPVLADKLTAVSYSGLYSKTKDVGIGLYTDVSYGLVIRTTDMTLTTTSAINTYLSSNPITVYYALATATDTKITDSTLIGELEAIHEWMTRYGYQASVTGNLPMIIRQDALT